MHAHRPATRVVVLVLALVALAGARRCEATEGLPVRIRSVSPITAPAKAGEAIGGELEISVGRPGTVDDFRMEGSGWVFDLRESLVGRTLTPGQAVRLPWSGVPADADQPFRIVLSMHGRELVKLVDLSPRHFEKVVGTAEVLPVAVDAKAAPTAVGPAGASQAVLRPAARQRPAPRDRLPSLRSIGEETYDLVTDAAAKRARSITVSGRFVYTDEDGRTIGADGVTVRVYDEDWAWDQQLSEGLTDPFGNFSHTFTWDPGVFDDGQPDIYVEFALENGRAQVEGPGLLEGAYTFTNGTRADFTGTSLDVGWLRPRDEADQPAPHLLNSVVRTWRWVFDNEGYDVPHLDAVWPDGETGAHHTGWLDSIYISPERQWREDTHAHEYGHHVMDEFSDTPSPDYCNSLCDSPDCGHCIWCQETDHDAFNEGWPNWLADVVTRAFPGLYGYPTLYTRSQESLGACTDSAGNPCPCDPLLTEGFVGALLRDIEDADFGDAHPRFPGFRDRLSLGTDEIFTVTLTDEPTTVTGFLNYFKSRYPTQVEGLWETAKNCGYEIDTANPGLATGFGSTSHATTGDSPDATVDLVWSHAPDDASGIAGYAITAGPSASVPPPVMLVERVTSHTFGPLGVGTWYFNIRAVDRAGRWSAGAVTFGPVTIRPPTPANLVASAAAGWAAPVVPRGSTGATAGSVPASATLPGDAQATYWNARVLNSGEQSTGTASNLRVRLDGINYFNVLDPPRGSAAVPVLAAGAANAVLNQSPVFVNGGRHVFGAEVDVTGAIHESSELDNRYAAQWIWSPHVLAPEGGTYRLNVPIRDGGWSEASGALYYNCDGVRFTSSGWWNVAWMYASDNEHDFDLRLHTASTGATNGFGANLGWSARGAGCLDAVLVNRNQTGAVEPWDAGVIRGAADTAPTLRTYNLAHEISQQVGFNAPTSVSLLAFEMIALREFLVPGAGNVSVDILLADPAQGPVHLLWFDSSFATGDLADADVWATTGADGRARIDRAVAAGGYFCAVVLRDPKDGDPALPLALTLRAGSTPPDLAVTVPGGWYAPLVPRVLKEGTPSFVPPPAWLEGGASTYFSFAVRNDSPAPAVGDVGVGMYCDGTPCLSATILGGLGATATGAWVWPFGATIPAGRHSVALSVDPAQAHLEMSEGNNTYGEQWSWRPVLPLPPGPTGLQPSPPDPVAGFDRITTGEFVFNANGHRSPLFAPAGNNGWWGVIAAAPVGDSDIDLRLHPTTDDPKTAFTVSSAFSGWGAGSTDLLLMNMNLTDDRQFDVGVLAVDGGTIGARGGLETQGADGYRLDVQASTFLEADPTGIHGPYALDPHQLVRVHELLLSAGTHSVRVDALDGLVDYGVSVYGPAQAHYGKSDALAAAWFAPAGEDESVGVDVVTPGYYALCVWKRGSDDAPLSGQYRLEFGTPTAAPDIALLRTDLAAAWPNPFNPRTNVSFTLQEGGPTRLCVFNARGERIRTLVGHTLASGRHEVEWDGRDDSGTPVASGSYVVELQHGAVRAARKLTLVK